MSEQHVVVLGIMLMTWVVVFILFYYTTYRGGVR
jgi:hypothetical protein